MRGRWVAWVAVALLVLLGHARASHDHAPVRCPGGRYVVREAQILYGSGAPLPTDVIDFASHLSIASGCEAVPARTRATTRGTVVRARWRSCRHLYGGAVLRARLDPSCETMTGVFLGRRAKLRRAFIATRSSCGDGVYDAEIEACDAGRGCQFGPCTDACQCAAASTTSRTSTTVTSTPTTSLASTTTTSTTTAPTTSEQPTTTASTTQPTTTVTSTSTTTSTTLVAGPMDLVPVAVEAPAAVVAGQLVTVRWTVENRSGATAGPQWNDQVSFSTDAALGSDTLLASTSWTLGVVAGGSYTTAQPLRVPLVAPGNYYWLVRVDATNAKAEGDETNNLIAVPVTVSAP